MFVFFSGIYNSVLDFDRFGWGNLVFVSKYVVDDNACFAVLP